MFDPYPDGTVAIDRWARLHGMSVPDARLRFAQYVVLSAIARDARLRRALVFKGGNALDFCWMPNRSTVDLDFSLDMEAHDGVNIPETLSDALVSALIEAERRHLVRMRLHSVRAMPPGAGKTFVTMQARIGYALAEQRALVARMERGDHSAQVVPVEVSLNEPLVENALHQLGPEIPSLRVATLNDIAAEKLRALLQQRLRNRTRRQDVLDLAVMLDNADSLDRTIVARALMLKARARNVPVSRAAFHHPEIASRAEQGYDLLAPRARTIFIPFDEAFAAVLAFVDMLDIPSE